MKKEISSYNLSVYETNLHRLEFISDWVHVISDAPDVQCEFEMGEAYCKTVEHAVDRVIRRLNRKKIKSYGQLSLSFLELRKAYVLAHILFEKALQSSVWNAENAVKLWDCKRMCEIALDRIDACK